MPPLNIDESLHQMARIHRLNTAAPENAQTPPGDAQRLAQPARARRPPGARAALYVELGRRRVHPDAGEVPAG